MRKIGGTCNQDGCNEPYYGLGMCKKHYSHERNKARKVELAERSHAYYMANRERILAHKKEYRASRPEVIRHYARVRRARKHGGTYASYTEAQVLEMYGTVCHICLEEIDMNAPRRTGLPGWERGLHIDHNIGIAKGGDDNILNVRPAHGLCNVRKKRR